MSGGGLGGWIGQPHWSMLIVVRSLVCRNQEALLAEIKSNTRNYVHLNLFGVRRVGPPCFVFVFYSSLEWTNQTLESTFFMFFQVFYFHCTRR